MQFKVPQFLEIEDKIFGPFTFRQFVYLVGGGGICFVLYKLLGVFVGAIPILAVAIFSGMLIFYRPNNKPFLDVLEAGFKYGFQSKLYIWQRGRKKPTLKEAKISVDTGVPSNQAKLTGSKLRDLAWSLDVLDMKKEG